jgi:acetyl-CoA carboxylase biotin carboxyl carrier protein
MDLKDIQELIKFVAKSGATEVDLEIDNIKISIKSPAKKKRGEAEEPENIIQQKIYLQKRL